MEPRRYITNADVSEALRKLYEEDAEANLQRAFLLALSDDLKPLDAKGRWRPSPVVVILGCLFFAIALIFIYFSLGGQL